MINNMIDRWIRWRYHRWEVRIAEQLERKLYGGDRFDVYEQIMTEKTTGRWVFAILVTAAGFGLEGGTPAHRAEITARSHPPRHLPDVFRLASRVFPSAATLPGRATRPGRN